MVRACLGVWFSCSAGCCSTGSATRCCCWVPLRQRPGIGTLCNVVTIGAVIDLVLAVVPAPHALPVQILVMVCGVGLNGVATGLYIGAGLGPGPRDGLMTGIAVRGHSIRVVRTGIEATVLLIGWLLGGRAGRAAHRGAAGSDR